MNEHELPEDESYVLTLDDFATMSDSDVQVMTSETTKFRYIEPINIYWRVDGVIIDYPIGMDSYSVDTILSIIDEVGGNTPKLLRDSNGIASIVVDIPTHNQKEN